MQITFPLINVHNTDVIHTCNWLLFLLELTSLWRYVIRRGLFTRDQQLQWQRQTECELNVSYFHRYGEQNYDDMLSRFHLIPERYGQTDGWTDRQTDSRTDRIAISISRISVLTRDKNLTFKAASNAGGV